MWIYHPHMHHATSPSLNRLAASATTHCLIGCGIGEVLGLVIADALGWDTVAAIVLAVVLAFAFGYALTMRPLVASGMTLRTATRTALVADTASITEPEVATWRWKSSPPSTSTVSGSAVIGRLLRAPVTMISSCSSVAA